jgi:hypothetical protein
MPRVIVEDHSGLIWRGSGIAILIDGIEREKLKPNVRADFAIGAGGHTIQARSPGTISRPVQFVARDRETLSFACFSEGLLKKSLSLKQTAHQRHQDRFERDRGLRVALS